MSSYDRIEYAIDRLMPVFEMNNGLCDLEVAELYFRDKDGSARVSIFIDADGLPSISAKVTS